MLKSDLYLPQLKNRAATPSAIVEWQPTASVATLTARAKIMRKLRDWFFENNILEVETPHLSNAATTDPHIESYAVDDRHLRTSAEFHLKRLLAAGFPDVYELGKVFRVDESGRHHNPEFTMLEWYRLGIDHHTLMTECESLLRYLHADNSLSLARVSYRDFWLQHTRIDLATASCVDIALFLKDSGIDVPQSIADSFDALQDLAMGTALADRLPKGQYSALYDYPASQASLARIDDSDAAWPVANRFEIYFGSVELANGFFELTDAEEQLERFNTDNAARAEQGLKSMPVDHHLVAALRHGLPECAGVAVGLDRLMMILLDEVESLSEVVSFSWERA